MPLHRTATPVKRQVDYMFPIPEGLADLTYPEVPPEEDGLLEDADDFEEEAPEPGRKKRVKKKRKHRKKKKKGKRKNKDKDKKKRRKKDKDDDRGKADPRTPRDLTIVRQTMRTKRDGSQVVDVVVQVDKVRAADKYEFRITKKDTGVTTVV